MKLRIILLFLLSFSSKAQNTVLLYQNAKGYSKKLITSNKDTLEVCFYPNGKVESKRTAYPDKRTFEQTRYYPNGKVMWKRTMKDEKANGPTVYFNERGKRLITITFLNNSPVDTVIHNKGALVVAGNYQYWSSVYGGAEKEDGTSNISEHSGPGVFMEFKLIEQRIDSAKNDRLGYSFHTDGYGNFLIILPKSKNQFGIFPATYPNELIKNGMMFPPDSFESSGSSSWHLTEEIIADDKTHFIYTELRSSSVGYAP